MLLFRSFPGSGEGKTMYLYRRRNVEAGLKVERIIEVGPFVRQDRFDYSLHGCIWLSIGWTPVFATCSGPIDVMAEDSASGTRR